MSLEEVKNLIDFGKLQDAIHLIDKLEGPEQPYGLVEKVGILGYIGKIDESIELSLYVEILGKKLGDKVLEIAAKSFRAFWLIWKDDVSRILDLIREAEVEINELELKDRTKAWRYEGIFKLSHGLYYQKRGHFNKSLTSYYEVLELWEKCDWRFGINVIWGYLGTLHLFRGELDLSLEFFEKRLMHAEKFNNGSWAARGLMQIAEYHTLKYEYNEAITKYEESLVLYKELGETRRLPDVVYNLIKLLVKSGNISKAESYLKELDRIRLSTNNKNVYFLYELARAIILKSSKQRKNKLKARKIFSEIINQELIDAELKMFAIINICDLILELKDTGKKEMLNQIQIFSKQLQEIGENENMALVLIESYILQSKLALLTPNFEKAFQLLKEAETIAQKELFDESLVKIKSLEDEFNQILNNLYTEIGTKKDLSDHVGLEEIAQYLRNALNIYKMSLKR